AMRGFENPTGKNLQATGGLDAADGQQRSAGGWLVADRALLNSASGQRLQRDKGQSIHFLVNNNSLGQALASRKAEFEKLTGIKVTVNMYQEQQMRQRLLTVLNAKSSEIDVFMTLPSREGEQFADAGWLSDLSNRVKADA